MLERLPLAPYNGVLMMILRSLSDQLSLGRVLISFLLSNLAIYAYLGASTEHDSSQRDQIPFISPNTLNYSALISQDNSHIFVSFELTVEEMWYHHGSHVDPALDSRFDVSDCKSKSMVFIQ